MSVEKKPSEKVAKTPIDGMQVTDSLGRILRLREPDILDQYDLFSAMGEDTKSQICLVMGVKLLYVATIDNLVVESPKSYAQFRATLKRVGQEGILAIDEVFAKLELNKSDKEAIEKAKK